MSRKIRMFTGYVVIALIVVLGIFFLDLMNYRNHYVISDSAYHLYAFACGAMVCIGVSCFISLSSKRRFCLFILLSFLGSFLMNISILNFGFNYGVYKKSVEFFEKESLYTLCLNSIRSYSIDFQCGETLLLPFILIVIIPMSLFISFIGIREYYYFRRVEPELR